MRKAGRIAAVVAGVLAVITGLAWLFQRQMIYFPDRSGVPSADAIVDGGRDVTLDTSDDLELTAWYVPARAECGLTVLVAPGNGGNRLGRSELMQNLHERGFGVLQLEYRGYADNPGRPTEDGLRRDAQAAYAFLTETEGLAPEDLVYFGESLGSAVVADLAAEHPPAAILLRSPFSSLADAARSNYGLPLGWLLRDHFRVSEAIAAHPHRLAVVYGNADSIVPAEQSSEVAEAGRRAGGEVAEVELLDADHNDAELVHGSEVIDALVDLTDGRCG